MVNCITPINNCISKTNKSFTKKKILDGLMIENYVKNSSTSTLPIRWVSGILRCQCQRVVMASLDNRGDGDYLARNHSAPNSDSEEGDLVLEFHDKKITQQYCLILREYDGKGVFVMRLPDQENVVGLFEIVHTLKMKHLFRRRPITVRDIVSRYVVRMWFTSWFLRIRNYNS